MISERDKMFKSEKVQTFAIDREEMERKAVDILDTLALDIHSGNVEVEYLDEIREVKRSPTGEFQPAEVTKLEVVYNEY